MVDINKDPAIRVLMMPRDTNYHGTIFGGVILSHIDQAGAIGAIRRGCRKVVTVTMDEVVFHKPVNVGDVVSYYADVCRVGRTSITMCVTVEVTHRDGGTDKVTQANVTYVNVDDDRKPIPVPDEG